MSKHGKARVQAPAEVEEKAALINFAKGDAAAEEALTEYVAADIEEGILSDSINAEADSDAGRLAAQEAIRDYQAATVEAKAAASEASSQGTAGRKGR